MFRIIQSNDTDTLIDHLIEHYKNATAPTLGLSVFSPFTVIVPSMVLGDWLGKTIATKVGISTLFMSEFWGKYQWQMTQKVLEQDAKIYPNDAISVPEVAVLSASIMKWRIFGYLSGEIKARQRAILDNPDDVLHFLLKPLYDKDAGVIVEQRLWQVCDELSRVYVRYLTHRPHWLLAWAKGHSLGDDVQAMMNHKARFEKAFSTLRPSLDEAEEADDDSEFPQWLQDHYLALERLLGKLWFELFGQTYLYREQLEQRFWQALSGERGEQVEILAKDALPKCLYLFTVQQIPQVELDFLKRFSLYRDVVLFHFNPSRLFWADIVDKNWLLTQQIINPDSVYLKDYGHGLLSRLGKESRETFAMLADMTGGADSDEWQIVWQDEFVSHLTGEQGEKYSVLNGLKQDILMLSGEQTTQSLSTELFKALQGDDLSPLADKSRPKTALPLQDTSRSLSIHACHSLKRQLEIARLMIAKYLNEDDDRQLSDVVVLLPDVAVAEDLIRSVFPSGAGVDGLTLPIKITGTTDKAIDELVFAISGFYTLLGDASARFYAEDVYEWLLTPALYESFGLGFEQMKKGCDLLTQAGFRRGFDELHLQNTLSPQDHDFRYSFSYALDRIVLGFLSPSEKSSHALHPFSQAQNGLKEAVLPLSGISLSDEPIIGALTSIYQGLADNRLALERVDYVDRLLGDIEHQVINRYFAPHHQSIAMRAIFNTKNAIMASLRANKWYDSHTGKESAKPTGGDIKLSLKFVLKSLSDSVKAQAISAEPAQVITFARFGALRSIPFGLTVMLDMNLASFPRQDKAVRLDLMKAGLNRRGDRYNEDDDNGAFLDALLCTRDRVLIFYNGISADGQTVLLPASPVGELIEFLKTDALWQVPDDANIFGDTTDNSGQSLANVLPNLLESYLTTYHAPTAFDHGVFYQNPSVARDTGDDDELYRYLNEQITQNKQNYNKSLPPPPLWCRVREVLDNPRHSKVRTVTLPSQAELTNFARFMTYNLSADNQDPDNFINKLAQAFNIPNGQEQLSSVLQVVKYPVKVYLKGKVNLAKDDDVFNRDEPLVLDRLGEYGLHELFISLASLGVFDDDSFSGLDQDNLLNSIQKLIDNSTDETQREKLQAFMSLYYDDVIPAGVPRLSLPTQELQKFFDKVQNFQETLQETWKDLQLSNKKDNELYDIFEKLQTKLSALNYSSWVTPSSDDTVSLKFGEFYYQLSAKVSDETHDIWLNILPKRASAYHLLACFAQHLCWQLTLNDHIEQKISLWQFYKPWGSASPYKEKSLFIFKPVDKTLAKLWLVNLIAIFEYGKQTPLAFNIADVFDCVTNGGTSLPNWLAKESKFGKKYTPLDSSHHPYWQFVLQDSDPKKSFEHTLPIMESLIETMNQHLKILD